MNLNLMCLVYFSQMKKIFILIVCFCFILDLVNCQITLPNQPVKDALFLHYTVSSNKTVKDCVFRNVNDIDSCPDPFIKYVLYSGDKREIIDYKKSNWLKESIWDENKENIFIVHGYASSENSLPINVLRDAYKSNGSFNVWMLDWSILAEPPCYRSAVHNLKSIAKCTGELIVSLKLSGANTDRLTCIGHSLGSHICGLISRSSSNRFNKIFALDPARPLITPAVKISINDAGMVQVFHTNAGHYGERDRVGHVDFCINGGRTQPFCENLPIDAQLCSHVWSVCFMAESLNLGRARLANPCTRRCPPPPRPLHKAGSSILMGHHAPATASGTFCIHDTSKIPPFCPQSPGDIGDKRCCLDAFDLGNTTPISSDPQ